MAIEPAVTWKNNWRCPRCDHGSFTVEDVGRTATGRVTSEVKCLGCFEKYHILWRHDKPLSFIVAAEWTLRENSRGRKVYYVVAIEDLRRFAARKADKSAS